MQKLELLSYVVLGYEVECDDDAEAILLGIYFQKGVDKETLI